MPPNCQLVLDPADACCKTPLCQATSTQTPDATPTAGPGATPVSGQTTVSPPTGETGSPTPSVSVYNTLMPKSECNGFLLFSYSHINPFMQQTQIHTDLTEKGNFIDKVPESKMQSLFLLRFGGPVPPTSTSIYPPSVGIITGFYSFSSRHHLTKTLIEQYEILLVMYVNCNQEQHLSLLLFRTYRRSIVNNMFPNHFAKTGNYTKATKFLYLLIQRILSSGVGAENDLTSENLHHPHFNLF